jgi:hypothetical protein
MRNFISLAILLFASLPSGIVCSQQPSDEKANPYAVATFECAGIYWKTTESGQCKVRYREVKKSVWTDNLGLVYAPIEGEYRGSIVNLKPATEYEIELFSDSDRTKLKVRTRDDRFPIGKITVVPEGESDKTISVTESGTPDGYHLITVPENSKSVLNLKNVSGNGIEIDADYVIIRGIEIRNSAIHGIRIRKNRHDIVVEQCHITFWGRIGGPKTYGNLEGGYDSGIYAEEGTWNLTIQRNLIEDPRGASNDWETGHPDGPQGISIFQSKGGNIIRYNEILSSEDHGFNDGIGGGSNFSFTGNMNRDSDIHGNIIRNAWDDAIESEGGNMNVRIWGNYLHFFYNGIATASTSKGPLYIFRNVSGVSRSSHWNTMGGAFIKTGERNEFGGGRRFVFHNTILQPNGVFDAFSGHVNPNCVTRNNMFDVPGRLATDIEKEPVSNYDYDIFTGDSKGRSAKEEHSVKMSTTPSGTKLYIYSYNLEFYPRPTINSIKWGAYPYEFGDKKLNITDPVIWIKNPMINTGALIPGFNDNYKGTAPDIGAFETGVSPLQFGRRAYLNFDDERAPWEIY